MTGRTDRSPRWLGVFGAPILVAALTLTGLLAALMLGAFGRYLSWVTVAVPVIICLWTWLRVRISSRGSGR
jgi:amino acid transporter